MKEPKFKISIKAKKNWTHKKSKRKFRKGVTYVLPMTLKELRSYITSATSSYYDVLDFNISEKKIGI